jgi:glycosyltransferase involved in cell wall biosynthesis
MRPILHEALIFAIPGDLSILTGGYAYARRLLKELPHQGISIEPLRLPESFPHPTSADIAQTLYLLQQRPDALWLFDGLALGAFPPELLAALPQRSLALIHHPLALEEGLTVKQVRAFHQSEKEALALMQGIITTSHTTADVLVKDYAVSPEKLTIAEPGTDPAMRAKGTGSPFHWLAIGTVTPRKAFPLLVEALASLKDQNWFLTILGATDRNLEETHKLVAAIENHGLRERISLLGSCSATECEPFWQTADAFVSSSLYEGYGMVLTEAMARGLPLVASTGGAASATVPEHVGIKVEPGDLDAMQQAMARMMKNAPFRRTCADSSWECRKTLPKWEETARHVSEAVRRLLERFPI